LGRPLAICDFSFQFNNLYLGFSELFEGNVALLDNPRQQFTITLKLLIAILRIGQCAPQNEKLITFALRKRLFKRLPSDILTQPGKKRLQPSANNVSKEFITLFNGFLEFAVVRCASRCQSSGFIPKLLEQNPCFTISARCNSCRNLASSIPWQAKPSGGMRHFEGV
jgi:hypothetical protein